jgi:hypothetical protein
MSDSVRFPPRQKLATEGQPLPVGQVIGKGAYSLCKCGFKQLNACLGVARKGLNISDRR